MTKHKIYVKRQRQGLGARNVTAICRRAVKAVLQHEGIETMCEVSVLITDDKDIQEINKKYRDIDKPTDVLSFPNFEITAGEYDWMQDGAEENGLVHLGDIAISSGRAYAQAEEYGHHVGREISYLIVHATLHLLGYDHENAADKQLMRHKEESILNYLGLEKI